MPKAPKVAYVVKRYPRYSETFIVNEILALERLGVSLEIFALYPTTDTHFQDSIAQVRAPVNYLFADGLKALDLWSILEQTAASLPGLWPKLLAAQGQDPRHLYQAARLALAVRERDLQHIHAHFATAQANVARLAAHFAEVPFSFTAHAKDIFHQSVKMGDLGQKLEAATQVVTVSEYNLEYLKMRFDPAAKKLRRIYNGVDLTRFSFKASQDRPARIVAVGRLVEKKGFADLIEACAILDDRMVPFECKIVGAGPLETTLVEQIRRLKLSQRVELLGPRPQSEIIQLVQGAAVFAAPCVVGTDGDRDGLPTVLLEAMALGTACVSTDVTGIPEVLQHAQTGLLVAQHDPPQLAGALERLLGDPTLRLELSHQARALIEAEFDVHCNAQQLLQVFAESQLRPLEVV